LPSQDPSVPQLAAPLSAHWFNGSCPSATSVQVPAVPARLHDRHAPVHALRQHAPCSQNPLAHSVADPQLAPFDFLPQLVPLHTLGATHWVSAEQLVRQLPPVPQT
jgi:hypothetical protein